MRRTGAGVVVLVVLVGAVLVVDLVLRDQAERRIATEVQQAIPGVAEPPSVAIEGFPFLTQVAASRLGSVRLSAPEATVEGLRLEDVVVRVHGVTTEPPYVAESAELTALARPDDVEAVLGLPDMDLGVDDGELVATADVLGIPVDIALGVRPAGREVVVDVVALEMGGFRVDSSELPAALAAQLEGLRFAISGLPEGMVLTDVVVVADGVRLSAAAEHLAIGTL